MRTTGSSRTVTGDVDLATPAAPLITAKFTMPAPPPGAIARPRLNALLEAAAQVKLGLIAAPAGFGKTVAAAQWLSASPPPALAWLSLDQHDNQPARFWTYAVAALAQAGIPARPWAGRLIQAAGDESPGLALAPLVNALAGWDRGTVLVLDNCHLITDPRIHQALAFLVDHQPPSFHLVVLTRSDPLFLAARWTASGQVAQARTRDLAFTDEEMTGFLAAQGRSLSAELAGPLFARVRGWPAALRLVSLWLADRDDPAAALAEFAASDATIADYLTTEVLAQLPARLRRFLLQTSILPQLTGPLCEAVTGQPNGAATLARLHHSGLFTDAAGSGQDWFRYHDLFRELLQLELHRTRRTVPRLHQRAAAWFAANGFTSEAIDHGLAAGDWPAVQALIVGELLAIGSRYHPAVIEGWLAAIPPSVLQTGQVWLALHAFVLAQLGRLDDARHALTRSGELADEGGPEPSLPELGAFRHAIAAGIARLDCDLATAQRCYQAVDQELGQLGGGAGSLAAMARTGAANAVAGALFWHGDLPGARELLHHIDGETVSHQLVRMRVNCLAVTALLAATSGELRQAESLTAEALRLAQAAGVDGQFQVNPALLATAVTALHRGDHAQAQQEAAEVADRARRHADRGPLLLAHILLAQLAALRGDPARALTLLGEAGTAFPGWQPPPALQALAAEEQARVHLLSGDLPAARAVRALLQRLPPDNPVTSVATQVTSARVRQAEGHPAEAAALFSAVADAALTHRQLPRAVEALTEAAAAADAAGRTTAAAGYLGRALTLAGDEMITTPFTRSPATSHQPAAPAAAISDRERAVLRLLYGTLSNAEIAAALNISPNTLKTHIRNLYRKLGVTTRGQAVARAREFA